MWRISATLHVFFWAEKGVAAILGPSWIFGLCFSEAGYGSTAPFWVVRQWDLHSAKRDLYFIFGFLPCHLALTAAVSPPFLLGPFICCFSHTPRTACHGTVCCSTGRCSCWIEAIVCDIGIVGLVGLGTLFVCNYRVTRLRGVLYCRMRRKFTFAMLRTHCAVYDVQ